VKTNEALPFQLRISWMTLKGDTEVVLVLGPNKQTIKLPLKIETAQTMLDKLKNDCRI